jgi:hypothetical protein
MKIPLTYGAAMAIAGALLTLILFFAGFHDTAEKMQSGFAQTIAIIGPLGIAVACLALAMRDKRANTPADMPWGYGSAFGTGVMTGLFSALFGAVFAYVYFAVLNPDMADVVYQMQVSKMEAKGMPSDRIDAAEQIMRKMLSPIMMTTFQTFFGFLWTVVLSLIIAIFYKRRPVGGENLATPPTL